VNDLVGIVTPLRACGPAGGSVAKGMKKIRVSCIFVTDPITLELGKTS
jgi:hypothetical protein